MKLTKILHSCFWIGSGAIRLHKYLVIFPKTIILLLTSLTIGVISLIKFSHSIIISNII